MSVSIKDISWHNIWMKRILGILMMSMTLQAQASLPTGFVFLTDIDPTIVESVRYYGSENFLARPVPGYTVNRIILTDKAALALKKVNAELKAKGYKLVVYDGYRPQRAVNAFIDWEHHPEDDRAKVLYYPTLTKTEIFDQGYVGARSSHSRGSTADLTLIPLNEKLKPISIEGKTLSNSVTIPFLNDNTVDMGASFDFFDAVSHPTTDLITPEQQDMRDLLRAHMVSAGFEPYPTEWWHFTLKDEPFPDTYFDFVVE